MSRARPETAEHPLGRAFRQIVWARALIWIAGGVTSVALPLALYQRTGSAALAAVLAAFEATPYLLVGLAAGAMADRTSARSTSLICCMICAVASGSVPIAAALDLLTTPHLFVSAFCANVALVFFDAAMFAVLPAVVGSGDLMRAFSTTTAVGTAIRLVAPAGGGLLAAWISPEYALAVDTLMIVGAALVFFAFVEPSRTTVPTDVPMTTMIANGIRFIRRTVVVRTLTLLGTGNAVAEGIVTAMLIPAVVTVHERSADGLAVGVAFSVIAAGALTATVVAPRLSRRLTVGAITTAGLLTAALGLAGWTWSPWFGLGLVALFVYQVGATLVILNGIGVRAQLTPEHLQGRVNTTARMVAWGGQPVGGYAAGAVVGLVGVSITMWLGVLVLLLTAGAAAASGLRGYRTPVAPPPPPKTTTPRPITPSTTSETS